LELKGVNKDHEKRMKAIRKSFEELEKTVTDTT
jgi:hypothetical protein